MFLYNNLSKFLKACNKVSTSNNYNTLCLNIVVHYVDMKACGLFLSHLFCLFANHYKFM